LVTGTPGTGKTTLCESLASYFNFNHINISELVKQKQLYEGKDEEFDAFILDEDKVCDELEDKMVNGGNIVDFHSNDFFPERWFDLVIVLVTDNTILYDRLEKRGYLPNKIQENVECEIMAVVLDEARSSYKQEIMHVLQSNNIEDMEANIQRIKELVDNWQPKMQMS